MWTLDKTRAFIRHVLKEASGKGREIFAPHEAIVRKCLDPLARIAALIPLQTYVKFGWEDKDYELHETLEAAMAALDLDPRSANWYEYLRSEITPMAVITLKATSSQNPILKFYSPIFSIIDLYGMTWHETDERLDFKWLLKQASATDFSELDPFIKNRVMEAIHNDYPLKPDAELDVDLG